MPAQKNLVRPQLEYAATVWENSIKGQTSAIEIVQRRAVRFITADYSRRSIQEHTSMLQELQLEKLKTRRVRARATMLFRTVKGLGDLPTHQHLRPFDTVTRGHTRIFVKPICHVKSYGESFYPGRIARCNQFPWSLVDSESLEEFKLGIEKYIIH